MRNSSYDARKYSTGFVADNDFFRDLQRFVVYYLA